MHSSFAEPAKSSMAKGFLNRSKKAQAQDKAQDKAAEVKAVQSQLEGLKEMRRQEEEQLERLVEELKATSLRHSHKIYTFT